MFEFFRQTVFHYQHRAMNPSAVYYCCRSTVDTETHRGRDDDVEAGPVDTLGGEVVKAAATRGQQGLSASTSRLAEPTQCATRRRRRVLFSREQTAALEQWFARHSYVSPTDRDRLAASLALRPAQVKIWFQNRRYKLKKIRRQTERNRDRMSSSSVINSAVAAASLQFGAAELGVQSREMGCSWTVGQPSVVRRIAVPILVRDGRPCWSRAIRRSECQATNAQSHSINWR